MATESTPKKPKYNMAADFIGIAFNRFEAASSLAKQDKRDEATAKLKEAVGYMVRAMSANGMQELVGALDSMNAAAEPPNPEEVTATSVTELIDDLGIDPEAMEGLNFDNLDGAEGDDSSDEGSDGDQSEDLDIGDDGSDDGADNVEASESGETSLALANRLSLSGRAADRIMAAGYLPKK